MNPFEREGRYMNVLVTGGAGYIGSHIVAALREAGHTPVVIDTLENGFAPAVSGTPLFQGNVTDSELVGRVIREFSVDAVMHFAAYISVNESMSQPMKYYANNTAAALTLLKTMRENGVRRFIFSSTAATYGQPESSPITEEAPQKPINVYGHSKLLVEEACRWLAKLTDFQFVALRYFNACGAHPSGLIGEAHHPEAHLIPLILQVPLEQRRAISVYGEDYPTPDGTCIRDYIHVMDLARAHIKAMEYLVAGGESTAFNLGVGQGYSVQEIISAVRRITGHPIPVEKAERRAGDPAVLVASSEKARKILGWEPVESDLDSIISSAWRWHRDHPHGYTQIA